MSLRIMERRPVPPPLVLPRRQPAPASRPLHRRALRLRNRDPYAKGPPEHGPRPRDLFLLRTSELVHLQRRPTQRTPRLPRYSVDQTPRRLRDGQGILRAAPPPRELGIRHLEIHLGRKRRFELPREAQRRRTPSRWRSELERERGAGVEKNAYKKCLIRFMHSFRDLHNARLGDKIHVWRLGCFNRTYHG